MSAIWHGSSGIPGFTALVPMFSFYDQAQVEQPAPISYRVAQQFRATVQFPFGPDFRWEVRTRARLVWEAKRPWWCTVV